MQKLINSVQNYAWGSKTALTELYGMENQSSQPMAELWMGAHPKSSSRVQNAAGDIVSLRDVIESDKSTLLGEAVAKRFGELPFLFKVLCAAQPLSIQVHPVEPKPKLKDIMEPDVYSKYTITEHLWTYLQDRKIKQRAKGNGFGYSLAYPDGITHTLSARYHKDGADILIPQEGQCPRRLTPRECARLQGFPDTFVIPVCDGRAYKQFGNSVVVPLVADIASQVSKKMAEVVKAKK